MEGENLIPVRVSGNPVGNSGFQTLVELNNPSFDNEDKTSYQGFRDCQYFFSIVTEEKQTVYRLVRNGAKSFRAIRLGVLIISFSIHKGYKLAGGKTPYDVLCRLMDVFLSRGMTLQSSGDYEYKDRNTCEYGEILKDVVAEFNLVRETAVRHYPMVGSDIGLIIRPEEDIKELLKDITYPEFASYNEIFVATKPSSSPASYKVLNVTIPRPRIYKIYSKGLFWKDVTNTNESIFVQSDKSSAYYDTTPKSFTINQLLNGLRLNGVTIDPIEERVDVTPSLIDAPVREKLVEIEIRPAEIRGKINMNNLVLTDGNYRQIKFKDGNIILRGEEIAVFTQKSSNITARILGDDRYEVKNTRWEGDKLVIDVVEKPRPQSQPTGVNGGDRWSNGTVGGSSQNATASCVDITISLSNEFFKKRINESELPVILRDGGRKNKFSLSQKVSFEKSEGVYKGRFRVLLSQCNGKELIVETKKKTFSKRISLDNGGKLNLTQDDFEWKKRSSFDRYRRFYICLITALVMFVLGAVAGYVIPTLIKSNNEINGFLNNAEVKLASYDLSIADIETIYNEYSSNKLVYDRLNADVGSKIQRYNDLSEAIKAGDINIINRYTEELSINENHRQFIGRILQDEDSSKWFKKRCSTINSLKDIPGLYKFKCDDCKQYFENKEAKDGHKTECGFRSGGKVCHETFCNDEDLKRHKDNKHPKAAPPSFKCEKCGKAFYTTEKLERHKYIEHEGS